MAGPLSGLGSGQQIPLATTFQPGQSGSGQQVRPEEKKAEQNVVQSRGAESAQTQNVQPAKTLRVSSSGDEGSSSRGSLVDIKV